MKAPSKEWEEGDVAEPLPVDADAKAIADAKEAVRAAGAPAKVR